MDSAVWVLAFARTTLRKLCAQHTCCQEPLLPAAVSPSIPATHRRASSHVRRLRLFSRARDRRRPQGAGAAARAAEAEAAHGGARLSSAVQGGGARAEHPSSG